MKVLNFGSLNYDYVYKVQHMVQAGETISSEKMNVFCGGKGLNQSIALAKAGVPVYHAGAVGDDGDALLNECHINGVNTKYIRKVSGKSGHAIIQVDSQGQNCILLFDGANRKQTRTHIDQVLDDFEAGDILLLQNEINELGYLIDRAYEKKMVVIMNPSPFNDRLKECDWNKLSIFLINEIEGAQITGSDQSEEILNVLKKMYPRAKVVLTLGADGCIYQDGEQRIYQPCFPVKAVDTTAAGDTFTGYFIASLLEDCRLEDGLKKAAKAASIAVSREGAAPSIPEKEEVDWIPSASSWNVIASSI